MYVHGRTEAGEIRANLDQCLQFAVLLGPDDHPQVFLEFRIRLSPHELLTNQFLAKLRRALWVVDTIQFRDSIGKRVCIFMMAL